MKYPETVKDQQDKCPQVKDVEQEVIHDLANAEHEDEMSATKYHQPDYLYKNNSHVILSICVYKASEENSKFFFQKSSEINI